MVGVQVVRDESVRSAALLHSVTIVYGSCLTSPITCTNCIFHVELKLGQVK